MRRPTHRVVSIFVSAGLCVGLGFAPSAAASGFGTGQQGARAAGMAGAVVARADDPTAVFHNPGGPALADAWKGALGVGYDVVNERLYQGLGPALGTTGAQRDLDALPAHGAFIKPINQRLKVGFGLHTPYRLETEWQDPSTYPGRRITSAAEVVTYDLDLIASFKASKTFGVGIGVTWRASEISLERRVAGVDPTTGSLVDFGSLATDSDLEGALGWSVGFVHRPTERFWWGGSYRSEIETDFDAVGRMTQVSTGNTQLDQLFAGTQPFDLDLPATTSLTYPAVARLGVAVAITKQLVVEVDVEHAAWSALDTLSFAYVGESFLDQTVRLDLDDAISLRAGLEYTFLAGMQLRFGVAHEESPQPDATVGPLLMDGERLILAAGLGLDWLHLAFQWIDQDQRVVAGQIDNLDGNYRANAWRALFSLHM
ncbi:MAG: outer membrane protein transport protein [Acidobacteriota bacterium]